MFPSPDPSRTVASRCAPARPARVAAFLVVLGALLAAATAVAGEITVRATGVAYAVHDGATMVVGVTTVDADVVVALDEADAVIVAVRAALEEADVDPLDIRTEMYAVWREERFDDRSGVEPSAVFRVTHHLEVIVRDVDAVGALLGVATGAGANHVGGIEFVVRDRTVLEAEARERAYAAARAKAEQLAMLAGVTLGAPSSIVESIALAQPFERTEAQSMSMMRDAAPVSGGRAIVEIVLEVRFATLP
ncbi:hypothetical protein BH23DEI1_BH23DEI1_03210 [soil metagenome]